MNSRQLAAIMVGAAVAPVAVALGYVGVARESDQKPQAPARPWIYSEVTYAHADAQTDVRCQSKTNSVAFGNRVKAKPGDVYVMTCRAVRR